MVGSFLGLSRERSSARRYPAIHPLDSWSHYKSVVDQKDVGFAHDILRRGSEINQMMKVVGEEGTHIGDFVIYLKSEFLDFVYLQQNTFDDVDAACSAERQKYVFERVLEVLKDEFKFDNKDQARRFFLELRQFFSDWNYSPYQSDKFKQCEQAIAAKIKERIVNA